MVRRIFRLAVEGHGPYEISKILTQEKVECPAYYLARNGRGSRKNTVDTSRSYDWYGFTVSSMLTKPEYMGHTVNFRSSKKSYRDKRVKNDPSDWLIFENTHEAIVDPETWQAGPAGEADGAPDRYHRRRQSPHRSCVLCRLWSQDV